MSSYNLRLDCLWKKPRILYGLRIMCTSRHVIRLPNFQRAVNVYLLVNMPQAVSIVIFPVGIMQQAVWIEVDNMSSTSNPARVLKMWSFYFQCTPPPGKWLYVPWLATAADAHAKSYYCKMCDLIEN